MSLHPHLTICPFLPPPPPPTHSVGQVMASTHESFILQKTVVAVLNCMISPDWRHLPKFREDYSSQMKKDIELAWSSEPSNPIGYKFYYKIIDGDECGRDPTHDEFNWTSKSCLFLIANSGNKVMWPAELIYHTLIIHSCPYLQELLRPVYTGKFCRAIQCNFCCAVVNCVCKPAVILVQFITAVWDATHETWSLWVEVSLLRGCTAFVYEIDVHRCFALTNCTKITMKVEVNWKLLHNWSCWLQLQYDKNCIELHNKNHLSV